MSSQFWSLEVLETSPLLADGHPLAASSHGIPVRVCPWCPSHILILSSDKDSSHIGLGATLRPLFTLITSLKAITSKYSHFFFSLSLFKKVFVCVVFFMSIYYERKKDTHSAGRGGAERERETDRETERIQRKFQDLSCQHRARCGA